MIHPKSNRIVETCKPYKNEYNKANIENNYSTLHNLLRNVLWQQNKKAFIQCVKGAYVEWYLYSTFPSENISLKNEFHQKTSWLHFTGFNRDMVIYNLYYNNLKVLLKC